MKPNKNVQHDQNQYSKEADELQNSVIREFVEDNTIDSRKEGKVDESTAKIPDEQNRLITYRHQHNK
ncbi:hypothetical protein [Paenibacillus sp. HW567]|uniref:hypothetical protein n=1 Tax=Paenibacillus sp. HW567 TaxID=1034769 RepID=UPI00037A20C8|nr:hypothetical protein [Paenibacillus sp. HW567]